MKKATMSIRVRKGIENVEGYLSEDGLFLIHKTYDGWNVTDITTGLGAVRKHYKTRKEASTEGVQFARDAVARVSRDNAEQYNKWVREFNELMGKSNTEVKTESEGKTMSKNAKAKADTAPKAKRNNYKAENEALKREIEILKKQIEELTRVEKITIDTFDVEGYMASRDDSARITPELVEALENTEGLTVTRKGKDEWLYVSGATEADTKERKDIFKAMGFKWSANENAWFIAPYPLRSKKAWGAKKARKAMANA